MNNPPAYTIGTIKLCKIEDKIRSDEISFCISMLDICIVKCHVQKKISFTNIKII